MQKPIWSPSPERIERANLTRFMRFCREETGNADLNSYAPLWQFSVDQPERFWTLVWDFCGIRASGAREPVRQPREAGHGLQWFPGIRLNYAQNVLRFDDERPALLQRGADGSLQRISHAELRQQIAALAAALRADGVTAGDHVIGVLANSAEAIVAALATASLGAVWSAVPAGISATAFVERFGSVHPKALLLCASQAELADALPEVPRVILVPNGAAVLSSGVRVVTWQAFVEAHAGAAFEALATAFDHPLYLTEGPDPAHGAIHGAGGILIQHLKELVLHLDMKREDKVLIAADCGTAAWRWAVSSLAVGACLVLQPAPRSDTAAAALWDVIDACAITLAIADTEWLDRTRRIGLIPRDSHKLLALKTLACTGQPLPSELVAYAYAEVKDRLLLLSGPCSAGLVGCFALGAPLLPVYAQPAAHRALGMRTVVLDEHGMPVSNTPGELACAADYPSMPLALHDDDGTRYAAMLRDAAREHADAGSTATLSNDGCGVPSTASVTSVPALSPAA